MFRNPDEDLRKLERAVKENQQDLAAWKRWVVARGRCGDLNKWETTNFLTLIKFIEPQRALTSLVDRVLIHYFINIFKEHWNSPEPDPTYRNMAKITRIFEFSFPAVIIDLRCDPKGKITIEFFRWEPMQSWDPTYYSIRLSSSFSSAREGMDSGWLWHRFVPDAAVIEPELPGLDWDKPLQQNPTDPLPSLAQEIALMTKQEFLDLRNPGNKYHEEGTYDFDLSELNQNYQLHQVKAIQTGEGSFYIFKSNDDYLIRYEAYRGEDILAAIIHDGILYYSSTSLRHRLPTGYQESPKGPWIGFNIKQIKRVKYLEELMPLIDKIPEKNLQGFSYLYQQILVGGQPYQIRFRESPILDKGQTIVILNDLGWIVARASNEWGATLLMVAKEFRGRGLGKILGQVWYTWNPKYQSGGFTPTGRRNAIAMWEHRVREFLAKGWYSQLLRQNLLTKTRFREIIADLRHSKSVVTEKMETAKEKLPLFFIEKQDNYWGPTFIIYDEKFYQEEDEKYIYGFGFFRDTDVGSFLFTIDYERPFAKLTTYLALQIARNNQEKIYIGEGYGDFLELEGLRHIAIEGNYVQLTQDVLDLGLLRTYETTIRSNYDDIYKEKQDRLIEMAHQKWGI